MLEQAAAVVHCTCTLQYALTNSNSGAITASVVRGCSLRSIREVNFFILAAVSFSENLGEAGSGEKLMVDTPACQLEVQRGTLVGVSYAAPTFTDNMRSKVAITR